MQYIGPREAIPITTRMPGYRRGGFPLRWQDDQTGELPAAVQAYLSHRLGEKAAPTQDQIRLLCDYLRHVICAPIWNAGIELDDSPERIEVARQLVQLRQDIVHLQLTTTDAISEWMHRCMDIGIDPL